MLKSQTYIKRQYTQLLASVMIAISCIISQICMTLYASAAAVGTSEFLEFVFYYLTNSTNTVFSSDTSTNSNFTELSNPSQLYLVCTSDGKLGLTTNPGEQPSSVQDKSAIYTAIENAANNYQNHKTLMKNNTRMQSVCNIAVKFRDAFPKTTEFNKAYGKLTNYSWEVAFGDFELTNSTLTGNELHNCESGFNSMCTQAAVGAAFGEGFDLGNFDPDSGFANEVLSGAKGFVEGAFALISNIIMLLFMFQTACDVLYIVVEPVRPFLTNSGGAGGNNGKAEGVLGKIRLPICSGSAIEACGGKGGTPTNGNGAGQKQNVLIAYVLSRAPVIILCAVYLILTASGYWMEAIEWVTSFVITIFDWILSIGR